MGTSSVCPYHVHMQQEDPQHEGLAQLFETIVDVVGVQVVVPQTAGTVGEKVTRSHRRRAPGFCAFVWVILQQDWVKGQVPALRAY